MSVKTFKIHGKFKRNRKTQGFVKEMKGMKEDDVRELVLSTIGSLYNVKRYQITIDSVEEVAK